MKKILIPLPTYGFDPTEAAIPWKIISENNIEVTFITPDGRVAETDRIMLAGNKLGIFKSLLMARKDAVTAHSEMVNDKKFKLPLNYNAVNEKDFDGLLLTWRT